MIFALTPEWVGAGVAVSVALGGLGEWCRRRMKAIGEEWTRRAQALDARVSELANGQIVDHEKLKEEVDRRLTVQEQRNTSAVSEVHRRLDEVTREMARRIDVIRVEEKLDRLLLARGGGRG